MSEGEVKTFQALFSRPAAFDPNMIAYSKLLDKGFFGNKIFFRKTIDFHEIF